MSRHKNAEQRQMELRQELSTSGLTRREAAKLGLVVAGGALVGLNGRPVRAASALLPSPTTTPWVEEIGPAEPLAPVAPQSLEPAINPSAHQYYSRFPTSRAYLLNTLQRPHSFHRELQDSIMWGYNEGKQPGPLIDARYGEPVLIRVNNGLPSVTEHRGFGIPQIITHLHNFHSASESDGGPWDWYGTGQSKDHHYTMARAGFSEPGLVPTEFRDEMGGDRRESLNTLFFHDHRADFTAPNVYRGLLGLMRVFDERNSGQDTGDETTGWRLPSGEFDVPLIIQDRRFDTNGRLFFDQFDLDGVLGDVYTVNGKIQPFMRVKRRKYRIRLYTPGPARIYQLVFHNVVTRTPMPFTQVTHSGNFLERPLTRTGFELVPANRVDLILDFSAFPSGSKIRLANVLPMDNGRKPDRDSMPVDPGRTKNQIMEFRVEGDAVDPSRVPSFFRPYPLVDVASAARTRQWKLGRNNGQWSINGELFDPELDHDPRFLNNPRNPVTRNTSEVWVLENSSGGWEHPMHIHLEEGQVFRNNGVTVPPDRRVRTDIYHMWDEASEQQVLLRFRDFPDPDFSPPKVGLRDAGRYVMHCHNTTHEDHAMMVTWTLVPGK